MKASSSSSHGLNEGKEYALKIGSSFQSSRAQESYHVLRYDFKPASIDTSRPAELKIGGNNECTVTFPQDAGATTYKGGKKPCTKECVLIIDKMTGEITLERIASNIPLKKSRTGTVDRSGDLRKGGGNLSLTSSKSNKPSSSSREKHPTTTTTTTPPASMTSSSQWSSQSSSTDSQHSNSQPSSYNKTNGHNTNKLTKPTKQQPPETSTASSSDSSSSDSSDSESDFEEHAKALNNFTEIVANEAAAAAAAPPQSSHPPENNSQTGGRMPSDTLYKDLQLSDSNSDSD